MSFIPAKIVKAVAGAIVIGIIFYFIQKFLSPFLVAAVLAFFLEPLVSYLESKGIGRRKTVFTVLFVLLIMSNLLIFIVCTQMVVEIVKIIKVIPDYTEQFSAYFIKFYNSVPEEYSRVLSAGFEKYSGKIVEFLSHVNYKLVHLILALPGTVVWMLLLLISLYFILVDKEKIMCQLSLLIPNILTERIAEKSRVLQAKSLDILKVYFILVMFTALQTVIGLAILGIDYAVVIGIITGILDLLPFIGPGFIFIPWVIISFIKAEYVKTFALTALYVMLIISREILEAKMISGRLGLHPLLTIVAMYLGFQIIGFVGIVIGPVVFMVAKEFMGFKNIKCG